jgi:hypothetical protein
MSEVAMAETERDSVLAWAAGQLRWERRLRELEAAADPEGPGNDEGRTLAGATERAD